MTTAGMTEETMKKLLTIGKTLTVQIDVEELESLRARVQELEADNKEMNSHLSRIGAILDDVDYLGEHSVGVQALKNRVVELEDGMGEPFGFYYPEDINENTLVFKCATTNNDHGTMQPLFRTPPTVAAAIRKAAEFCKNLDNDENSDAHRVAADWCSRIILAIPHDDSALREFGVKIARATYSAVPKSRMQTFQEWAEAIVYRVLGEKKCS